MPSRVWREGCRSLSTGNALSSPGRSQEGPKATTHRGIVCGKQAFTPTVGFCTSEETRRDCVCRDGVVVSHPVCERRARGSNRNLSWRRRQCCLRTSEHVALLLVGSATVLAAARETTREGSIAEVDYREETHIDVARRREAAPHVEPHCLSSSCEFQKSGGRTIGTRWARREV